VRLARSLRILLAFALLGAQQLALAHQIWHVGKHGPLPAQEQLCDQHEALATVAGAVDAPAALLAGTTSADLSIQPAALAAAASPGFAPSSRGPPAFL
jgi:hypothetical protein